MLMRQKYTHSCSIYVHSYGIACNDAAQENVLPNFVQTSIDMNFFVELAHSKVHNF